MMNTSHSGYIDSMKDQSQIWKNFEMNTIAMTNFSNQSIFLKSISIQHDEFKACLNEIQGSVSKFCIQQVVLLTNIISALLNGICYYEIIDPSLLYENNTF